jgi:hypothetical protein
VPDVLTTRKITNLTGPGHTDPFGVGGTDLGAPAVAPDGNLVAVFGDTFEEDRVGGPGWRSPVVLLGDPRTLRTGIEWTASAGPGEYAAQVMAYRHMKRLRRGNLLGKRITTVIPTDLLTVGEDMFLHVMACEGLGNVHWTEILRSRDGGRTWEETGTTWSGDTFGGLFQMLTWCRGDDGYVYAFTTGFRRDAGLLLHRVPEDRVTDAGAWEPWGFRDGGWAWGNPPTLVLDGRLGELSLRRVEDRWVLSFFDEGGYRIDVLVLRGPTDDLFRARRATALTGCDWGEEDHSRGRVAQLYGGYVVPGSTLRELHLVVSQMHSESGAPYRAMQFRTDASALGQ